MSQVQLSEMINYVPSFVSMVETADRTPKADFTQACDKALNLGGLLTRILTELVIRDGVPEWFWPWIDVEREATSIRSFEPLVVHGLLQTPEYARAVLDVRATSDEHLEKLVNARLERQQILARDDPPVTVAIMDEGVLRRPVGGAEVMRGQLEYLVGLTGRRNIFLQVVTSSAGGYAGLGGPFVIAELPTGNELVFMEATFSGHTLERPDHVAQVTRLWESLRDEALPGKQSIEFIKEVANTWI